MSPANPPQYITKPLDTQAGGCGGTPASLPETDRKREKKAGLGQLPFEPLAQPRRLNRGQIEPTGKEVEYAVAKAMEDKDERVSRAAIRASGKIARASIKNLLGTKEEGPKEAPKNGNEQ